MLSHEPKNYALRRYDGRLILRGVAFRSSRAERYGEAFLRAAIDRLLDDDVAGVRAAFVAAVDRLRRRELATRDVTTVARLSKTPEEYLATRGERRELTYEALLGSGKTSWAPGDRVRVYRATGGRPVLVADLEDDAERDDDARDYDVEHYVRQLRDTYASRLARALSPDDYAAVVEPPEQPSLFPVDLRAARPILTILT
jgi:DNA polymerase elongation subunit (family B)